jgi:hypothetical protein
MGHCKHRAVRTATLRCKASLTALTSTWTWAMRWTAIHLLVVTAGGVCAVPALSFRQQDTVYNAQRVEGVQGNGERGYL